MRDAEQMILRISELLGLDEAARPEDMIAAIESLTSDGIAPQTEGAVDPAKFAPVDAMRELMTEHNEALQVIHEPNAEQKVTRATAAGDLSGGLQGWVLQRTGYCKERGVAALSR